MLREESLPLFKPLIQIIGDKDAGKTLLAEALIKHFSSKGLKVAYLKSCSCPVEVDKEGSDTSRAWLSGAYYVIAVAPNAIFIKMRPKDVTLKDLVFIYRLADVVVVEGFREKLREISRTAVRVICIPSRDKNFSNIVAEVDLRTKENISEKIKKIIAEVEKHVERISIASKVYQKLPKINCRKCGFSSCLDLSLAIAEGRASIAQCATLREDKVVLRVNGERVYLNSFVTNLLKDLVYAFISNLKLNLSREEIEEVELKLNFK